MPYVVWATPKLVRYLYLKNKKKGLILTLYNWNLPSENSSVLWATNTQVEILVRKINTMFFPHVTESLSSERPYVLCMGSTPAQIVRGTKVQWTWCDIIAEPQQPNEHCKSPVQACTLCNHGVSKGVKTRGVSHCGCAIYFKEYLEAKEELWKPNYFTMQKYNLQKII